MSPLVSVIVAIYQAEKYLDRLLASLLSQSYQNFELILIDDGSTDNSSKICDRYAKIDNRIIVFHNKNHGISFTRQFGLEHANGEYFIFADSDDWAEKNMLQEMVACATKIPGNADMVICDFFENTSISQNVISQKPEDISAKGILHGLFINLWASCWNKLIKRSVINKYKIEFPNNISCGEDTIFMLQLLTKDISVAYLPKAFYHYDRDINKNSLMHKAAKKSDAYLQNKIMIDWANLLLKDESYRFEYENMIYGNICDAVRRAGVPQKYFNENSMKYKTDVCKLHYIPNWKKLILYFSFKGWCEQVFNTYQTIYFLIRKIWHH